MQDRGNLASKSTFAVWESYRFVESAASFRAILIAIKSVKNRAALGPDRIRPEHLKNLSTALVSTLATLFTRYLSECK
ncbi:hypothetical protein ANCCEY_15876, partial [Ancylostoma ceylanicum]